MKKKILLILLLLTFTGCNEKYSNEVSTKDLCHCNQIEKCECTNKYQTIDKEQAKDLIYNESTFLIDVRSEEEYASGHIEGAISLPLDKIDNIKFSKTSNIIVYCKSGTRSKNAAIKLLDLGYVNVYDLGSMNNWN